MGVGQVGGGPDVVVVEVDEFEPLARQDPPEARLFEDIFGVAAVPLALGDEQVAYSPAPEYLGHGPDDGGVCVDMRGALDRLDQVGLEQDRLATRPACPQSQLGQSAADDSPQVIVVRGRPGDEDIGATERLIAVTKQLETASTRKHRSRSAEKPAAAETVGRGDRNASCPRDTTRTAGRVTRFITPPDLV